MNDLQIMGSLMVNARLRVPELAKRIGVSHQAVYSTIKGLNASPRIRSAIAEAIGKPVEEIWPPDPGTKIPRSPSQKRKRMKK